MKERASARHKTEKSRSGACPNPPNMFDLSISLIPCEPKKYKIVYKQPTLLSATS